MVRPSTVFALTVCLLAGCASVPGDGADRGPKTLLKWEAGGPDEAKGDAADDKAGTPAGADAEDPLVSDRPDFTEASSTVGAGRLQIEAGYTLIRDRADGTRTTAHSYPEILVRAGLFADWFELRLGQNYASATAKGGGTIDSARGLDDLYVGAKLALTEQKTFLPEAAIVLQATVPTGADSLSSGKVQPGANLLYSWDLVPDLLSFGGSTQGNLAVDDARHSYLELAQSLTTGYSITDKLGLYLEWFALFPTGASVPGVTAQHYVDGGFTYQPTANLQFDIRVGYSLSRRADDVFVGTGIVVRY